MFRLAVGLPSFLFGSCIFWTYSKLCGFSCYVTEWAKAKAVEHIFAIVVRCGHYFLIMHDVHFLFWQLFQLSVSQRFLQISGRSWYSFSGKPCLSGQRLSWKCSVQFFRIFSEYVFLTTGRHSVGPSPAAFLPSATHKYFRLGFCRRRFDLINFCCFALWLFSQVEIFVKKFRNIRFNNAFQGRCQLPVKFYGLFYRLY